MSTGAITITTPRGSKIRSASKRRFHVVRVVVDRATTNETSARVVRRSDDLATARKAASAQRFIGAERITNGLVFDTVTRQFVDGVGGGR